MNESAETINLVDLRKLIKTLGKRTAGLLMKRAQQSSPELLSKEIEGLAGIAKTLEKKVCEVRYRADQEALMALASRFRAASKLMTSVKCRNTLQN